MPRFQLVTDCEPTDDQPTAIGQLVDYIELSRYLDEVYMHKRIHSSLG